MMVLKIFFGFLIVTSLAFSHTQGVDKLALFMQEAQMCENLMYLKELVSEADDSTKTEETGIARLNQILECKNLQDGYRKIAFAYLSESDIDTLRAFYASSLGQKFMMAMTTSYKMESKISSKPISLERKEKIKGLLQALGTDKMVITSLNLKLDFDAKFSKKHVPEDPEFKLFLHKFIGSFVTTSFEQELSSFSDEEIDELTLFYAKNQSAKNEVILDAVFLEQIAKELVK